MPKYRIWFSHLVHLRSYWLPTWLPKGTSYLPGLCQMSQNMQNGFIWKHLSQESTYIKTERSSHMIGITFFMKVNRRNRKSLLRSSLKNHFSLLHPNSNHCWHLPWKGHSFHQSKLFVYTLEVFLLLKVITYSVCYLRASRNKFTIRVMMTWVKLKKKSMKGF